MDATKLTERDPHLPRKNAPSRFLPDLLLTHICITVVPSRHVREEQRHQF